MGKTLKTVGMVIGAAALIATGAGAILMPGLAGGVTLFGVSAGTLNLVSAGLTAVGGLLDKPQSTGSGSPADWTSNPDQPTPFAFGRVGVSGKIIHRDEYGKDNKLQGIVSVYSGAGPIRGFVSYKADDLPVSFVSNGGTAIGKYNRQMWRSWRLGNQPDTALSLPTGLDEGAVMPAWDARYKLSGKACELLTVQQDSKFSVYPGGCPTPLAELDGIFGYDPRYDDTYPGGVGTCRLGVRSTYRWIENPIIAGLNWALGMIENGQVVGGIGASINGIDVPAFVEAANIADANDWKVTAWPDTSEDVSQVLKQFLQAGGASYARHAGKISCVSRGAARASIVTITARDTCGPLELDTGSSDFNRLNTITPEFMSAAHGWKHVPADPVTFASLRTEDGGKKSDSIQYRFVPSAKQAGQLAAYDILDAREPFSGTIPLKPHLRRLKRGDCFVIAEPGFLLDGVKCLVLSRTYDAQTGEARIAFRSETDGKHDLALGKTATMPEYPVLTPADPTLVSPPMPEDWVIVPRPPGSDGVQVPIVDVIGEVSNGTATAVHFEWSLNPDGPWKSAGIWPPTVTEVPIPAEAGAQIWLRVSYLRGENYSDPMPYGPITVPGLIGDVTPNAPGLSQIKADLEAAFGDIFDVSGLLAEARSDIDAQGVEIAAARGGQPNLNSRIVQVNQARIDGDASNAEAISLVQARTSNTEADIIDLANAQAAETLARAEAINQVNARSGLRANLIDNPSGAGDFRSWIKEGSPASYVDDDRLAGRIFVVYGYMVSKVYPAAAGDQHSLGFVASPLGDGGHVRLQYVTPSGFVEGALVLSGSAGYDVRRRSTAPSTAPAGTTGFRVVVVPPTGGVLPVWAIKVNFGSVASDFSDDYSSTVLSASVTEQSLAIVDLENQQALAYYSIKAEATGGKPTILELISGVRSAIALTAEQIYFGDNTVFDDATDTIQTVWGTTRKVMAWGAPFGPDNLVEWTGPSSVALGSMTKANAGFWQDQTGAYGPTPTPLFWARATPPSITKTRMGAGPISTAVNDVVVSCYTGIVGATCTWTRVSGDPTIGFPSTGFAPTFNATLALGETKSAVFAGLVTKGGEVALVYVNVEFQENT